MISIRDLVVSGLTAAVVGALPGWEVISREALRGRDSYAALGLTGANKPNGLEYRLRAHVPDKLPGYVPRTSDGLPLQLAQVTPEGWLALYASRSDAPANPRYQAALLCG